MIAENDFVDVLKNHTHSILTDGYFGKKNKSVEEKVRCFLVIMLQHLKFSGLKMCKMANRSNTNGLNNSDNNNGNNDITNKIHEDHIFLKYITIANELFSIDSRVEVNIINENVSKSIQELMRDDAFIYLLEHINELTYTEANLIYKIAKTLLVLCKIEKFENKAEVVNFLKNTQTFIGIHLVQINELLLNNLNPVNKDYVIIIIAKIYKKLFQINKFFVKLLTFNLFKQIYYHTKSDKFILCQECFKLIFYMISSVKVDQEVVSNFFNENAPELSSTIIEAIGYSGLTKRHEKECVVDDFYYMKRETLILLEKLLINPQFDKFYNYFTNRIENLKTIMIQLNNKCEKIICQAVDILYFFFLDIETKEKNIKKILHANKRNFYTFFDNNQEMFSETPEMMEKKSFILYELERLENYLD